MSDSIQHQKRDTYGKNIDLSNRIWYKKKKQKKHK